MIIKDIKRLRRGHYQLVCDEQCIDVAEHMLASYHLYKGKAVERDLIEVMTAAYRQTSCRQKALVLLSYRDHFRAELSAKLTKRGFDEDVVAAVVVQLVAEGLIDESARARDIVTNDGARLSRLQLRRRLQQMGCPQVVIEQAVRGSGSECDVAYAQLVKKTRGESASHIADRREKLLGFLARRGFNYDDANRAYRQLLADKTSESADFL